MNSFIKNISNLFLAIIVPLATYKTISILMKGQSDGIGVKESLQKVKTVIKAAIVCLCITLIIAVLQNYF